MTVSGPSAQASLVPALCAHGPVARHPRQPLCPAALAAKPPVYGACKLLDMELEMVSQASVSARASHGSSAPRKGCPGSLPGVPAWLPPGQSILARLPFCELAELTASVPRSTRRAGGGHERTRREWRRIGVPSVCVPRSAFSVPLTLWTRALRTTESRVILHLCAYFGGGAFAVLSCPLSVVL